MIARLIKTNQKQSMIISSTLVLGLPLNVMLIKQTLNIMSVDTWVTAVQLSGQISSRQVPEVNTFVYSTSESYRTDN